jgi:hypothetical protein
LGGKKVKIYIDNFTHFSLNNIEEKALPALKRWKGLK